MDPWTMQEPAPGQVISHYRIVERLGAGGMGVVYTAEDLSLGRLVALKFLPFTGLLDPQAVERFKREARTASTLNHPNICTIYGIDSYESRQFIEMELLEGQSLLQLIEGRPLDTKRLLDLGIQLADALDVAHAKGILHRDIKPANLFVTTRGQLKVLDFGLAKLAPAHRAEPADADGTVMQEMSTTPGLSMGTVAYMSPEQARAESLDVRSDLFSAGVVLYEMATGKRTFAGHSTALVFDAILNRMPPSPLTINPGLPPEVERIIGKALEKDRDLRYQSAADLRADLQRLRRTLDSSAASTVAANSGWTKGTGPNPQTGGWTGLATGEWETPRSGAMSGPPPTSGAAPQSAPVVEPQQLAAQTPQPVQTAPPVPMAQDTSSEAMQAASGQLVHASPVPALPAAKAAPRPTAAKPGGQLIAGFSQKQLLAGGALVLGVLILAAGSFFLGGSTPPATEQPAPPVEFEQPATPTATTPTVASPPPAEMPPPSSGAAPGPTASPPAAPVPSAARATPPPGASTQKPAPGATSASAVPKPAAPAPAVAVAAPPAAPPAAPVAATPPPSELAETALQDARATLARKQDDQAVSELRRLINTYPKTPAALDAHVLIAQVYERQNRLEEALAIYREAREAAPDDERVADVLLREARVMMRSRRPDRNVEARRLLAESAERFPTAPATAQALALKAQIEERDRLREQDPVLGSVPAALVTWRLMAERYPSSSETALLKLKDYYEDLRRYDLAAQALVDLSTRFPSKHDDALFEAGEMYERRVKDPAKALEIYSKVPASSDRYRRAQERIRELQKK